MKKGLSEKISLPLSLALRAWEREKDSFTLKVSLPSQTKLFSLQGPWVHSLESLPKTGIPLFQHIQKQGLVDSSRILYYLKTVLPANSQLANQLIEGEKCSKDRINQALYTIQQKIAAKTAKTAYLGTFLVDQGTLSQDGFSNLLSLQQKDQTTFSQALIKSGTLSSEEISTLRQDLLASGNLPIPRVEELVYKGRKFSRELLSRVLAEGLLEGLEFRESLLVLGVATLEEAEEITCLVQAKIEKPSSVPRLGDLLIAQGKVTREEVNGAMEEQKKTNQYLGEILLVKGYLAQEDLREALDKIRDLEKKAYIPDNILYLLVKQNLLSPEDARLGLASWEIAEEQASGFFTANQWLSTEDLKRVFQIMVEEELFSLMVYPELPMEIEWNAPLSPSFSRSFGLKEDVKNLLARIYDKLPSPEKESLWSLGLEEIYSQNPSQPLPPQPDNPGVEQLYQAIDGMTPLRKVLSQVGWGIEDAYGVLKDLEEKNYIFRYREDKLFQEAEEALAKKQFPKAQAYFEGLTKGILYAREARERIPMVAQGQKQRKMLVASLSAVFLLFLLVGGSLFIFSSSSNSSTTPNPGTPSGPQISAEQKTLLEKAKKLAQAGRGKEAFDIYKKLLHQKVPLAMVKLPFVVRTKPTGARVYLGDSLVGTTEDQGLVGYYPPNSKVELRVEKEGYLPEKREFSNNTWIDASFSLSLKPLWDWKGEFPMNGNLEKTPGAIFAASREGFVYSVDQQGKFLWKQKIGKFGDILSTPQTLGARVYVGNRRGEISALDLKSGNVLWQKRLPRALSSDPLLFSWQGKVWLTIAAEKTLYLLEGDTGKKSSLFSARHLLPAPPLWVEPYLYVGSLDNCIYSYSLPSRKIVWKTEMPEDMVFAPCYRKNSLYAVCGEELYKLNRFSGKTERKSALEEEAIESPFWIGKTLYLRHHHTLLLWGENLEGPKKIIQLQRRCNILRKGDFLSWVSPEGMVQVYDIKGEKVLWKEGVRGFALQSFLVDSSRLIFASEGGRMVAYPLKRP